jgi:hypothetical protein
VGQRPVRQSEALVREATGFLVLSDVSGRVVTVEGAVAQLWGRCDGSATIGEIVQWFVEQYRADPATVRSDVESTLSRLVEEGFLRLEDQPVPAEDPAVDVGQTGDGQIDDREIEGGA